METKDVLITADEAKQLKHDDEKGILGIHPIH